MKYITIIFVTLIFSFSSIAEDYKVNFKNVEITAFIDAVSKDLGMTIIVDPNVRGKIDIRSHESLNSKEYLSFFEYVLTAHGYSLVKLEGDIFKVIPSQATKAEAVPVLSADRPIKGDSVATKVIPVANVSVSRLTPILRQLINEAGSGNISHHDESNVIMITGRLSVIKRLEKIIKTIDTRNNQETIAISLRNAKASELLKIVKGLNSPVNNAGQGGVNQPVIVADDRTNIIVIAGSKQANAELRGIIRRLDTVVDQKDDMEVIYLQYAKAEDVTKVLQGVSSNLESGAQQPNPALSQRAVVTGDPSSNSVVIIASPERMQVMKKVVKQLDIRRAQVLIEAMIVEVTENDNTQYGVQWSNGKSAMVQFSGNGANISSVLLAKNSPHTDKVNVTGGIKGLMASIAFGDWNMLASALSGTTKSNILAAPSLMVLDNEEASFVVGEEVPVKTGEQVSDDFKNAFATIERKDVGIKLTIRPQINQGQMVQMKLKQEISNVIGANGAVDVRFGKRELNTSVVASDQQMIVLSGLIDQRNGETIQKVPVLGDIPLIGEAFKETIQSNEKRHLMLFIKPTIIRTDALATEASRKKYAQIRGKQGAAGEYLNIDQIPAYGELLNLPPEIQVIQRKLGSY
ncbi:MAG: type II secretion system secretin GspD [Gammaproteobacteria bacterium]|nr:type II secretion system secretin GspD [Gammaproteobacteria bacterium]